MFSDFHPFPSPPVLFFPSLPLTETREVGKKTIRLGGVKREKIKFALPFGVLRGWGEN
jgi:hypothetical protein